VEGFEHSKHCYAASWGIACSTNRKNRVLWAAATRLAKKSDLNRLPELFLSLFDPNNITNLAYRFKLPRFEIESDVKNADAMGEPADRDQVDAGRGNLWRCGGRDAARGFGDCPTCDQCDGFRGGTGNSAPPVRRSKYPAPGL
jgi:hypothetical protein